MFIDKSDEKLCDECGEPMRLLGDYGVSGQAFKCVLCGFYVEEIDLRDTTLTQN